MKKQVFLFLLTCVVTMAGQAQQMTATVVRGRIIDTDSLAVPGAAVVMQTLDSVYVAAVVSDNDGAFCIESPVRPYRLLFQHVVYKPFALEASTSEAGVIVLEESVNELTGLTVTAERPLLKVEDGKLAYDLRAITQNKIIDNAYDLLKELPSISSENNSLSLIGAMGSTDILISGKKSNMSFDQMLEYLRTLPADRVERVEVVYNPPPAWHVKGSAVNVVLKKEDKYTLQGQLQGRYTSQYANSYMGGGSLFLSAGKTALDVIYNYNDTHTRELDQLQTRHTVGDEVYAVESETRSKYHSQYHNLYLNLNHDFTEKNSLGIAYVGKYSPRKDVREATVSNLFSDADSDKQGSNYLHNISLTYTASFGLSAGAEYTNYCDDALQAMQYTRNSVPADAFTYDIGQRINRMKVYADMAHTLPHGWQLTYGVKYDYTDNTNTQAYEDREHDGEGSYDLSSSTEEHIADVYAGFKKTFFDDKLNIGASLTGELYRINEYENNALLPNATVTFTPVSKHTFQLAYRSLKVYPPYWRRQEYTSYSDEYSVSIGNPALRPAQYSFVNLMYILNGKYTLQASFYKINDYFMAQSYQSPDELKLIYKTLNAEFTTATMFTATVPLKLGEIMSTNLTANFYNERSKTKQWFDLAYDLNKWTWLFLMNSTFYISEKPNVSLNVYAYYKTPTTQGIWDLGTMWAVNAGIKWEIVKGKAVLNFQCNNIVADQFPLRVRYENQYQDRQFQYYRRNFQLSFSYNFKGYKDRRSKSVDTSRYGQ